MEIGSHSISSTPEHQFLRALTACTTRTTDKQIRELAQEKLRSLFTPSNAEKPISRAVGVLKRDVFVMESKKDAMAEVAGAINALHILKAQASGKDKERLNQKLGELEHFSRQVEHIFLLKEAIGADKQLLETIQDQSFLNLFDHLSSLYGENHPFDPAQLRSLVFAWSIPGSRPYLTQFIQYCEIARSANLMVLRAGKIPTLEEKFSQLASKSYAAWADFKNDLLSNQPKMAEGLRSFDALIEEIIFFRALTANSQVHTDSLRMAFNEGYQDKLSRRFLSQSADASREYQHKLGQLQVRLEQEDNPKVKEPIQKEIEELQKLEHCYPRDTQGKVYLKAQWIPQLSAEDPVPPLVRVIGFVIPKQGHRETSTRLDFTTALGPENLQLNAEERGILGELLFQCDAMQTKDPEICEHWKTVDTSGWAEKKLEEKFPERLHTVFRRFEAEQCPHLKTLSDKQKKMLVDEALRFAFEVNYHLADDQLNLG